MSPVKKVTATLSYTITLQVPSDTDIYNVKKRNELYNHSKALIDRNVGVITNFSLEEEYEYDSVS